MKAFLSLALLSLCVASPIEKRGIENTPEPIGYTAMSQADINMALKLHNDARAEQGYPPLRWDNRLAAGAQSYASVIANLDRLEHSGSDDGENLFQGWNRQGFASASWWFTTKEKPFYKGQVIPEDRNKNDFLKWGHYSQVMWRETTSVGMGYVQRGPQGKSWVVARYSPPGNYIGEKPY